MTDNRKLGKYEIIEELGRGGFGIVYKAKDCVLDRFVALKVLHSQLSVNPEFITHFAQEARLAAKLGHPNLVPVYDFDQREGHAFIVMGYMENGSLKDHLEKYGAISPGRVKTMLEQIASGLAYAHERDIIHRDLKPGNILIDANGMARISDFGFAKALQADSLSISIGGGMLGTPAYMAPEVWGGETATPASDVYSLGCIAHEMLTGEQLFKGETPVQVMYAHFMKSPAPIKGIAPAWQNFLDRFLMTKAEDRYPTASAVLEDLKWGLLNSSEELQSEIVLASVDEKNPEQDKKLEPMVDSLKTSKLIDQTDREHEPSTKNKVEKEAIEEIFEDGQTSPLETESKPLTETNTLEKLMNFLFGDFSPMNEQSSGDSNDAHDNDSCIEESKFGQELEINTKKKQEEQVLLNVLIVTFTLIILLIVAYLITIVL